MPQSDRLVLLAQLPIPPPAPQAIRGNVPLAAGYLKLFAQQKGLDAAYQFEILPTADANALSDCGLVEAILARDPWMVGFSCYLWNIDRTLWIAERLRQRRPDLRIVIGGPEVTADNDWVLCCPAIDYAVIGEGEQTFAELLEALLVADRPSVPIDGLYVRANTAGESAIGLPLAQAGGAPKFRRPLPNLDLISSPYLSGVLDAADEDMLLLETIRGCVFKCKFCYYPKSYDGLYFLSRDKTIANLRHARERGAREVVFLDPTLNQRKEFGEFLRLLAEQNADRRFTYFGELRGEGITPEIARLLSEANFTEVEIGLQSIDAQAQDLMDRKNNLRAFERGATAMLDQGIKVKVDLIIGLPGDTVESVRRGFHYVRDSGLYSSVQVFNLGILPGTAFRQEAAELGLVYQSRPPYYVLQTPTLELADMHGLMQEAQDVFGIEFDPLPEPVLTFPDDREPWACWQIDLDHATADLPSAASRRQAFTLWLKSRDFRRDRQQAAKWVAGILADNPHTTLQVVLEPTGDPRLLTAAVLEHLLGVCLQETSYLDRFYSVAPGRPKGAKRLVVVVPAEERASLGPEWVNDIGQWATIAWRGPEDAVQELEDHEYLFAATV